MPEGFVEEGVAFVSGCEAFKFFHPGKAAFHQPSIFVRDGAGDAFTGVGFHLSFGNDGLNSSAPYFSTK